MCACALPVWAASMVIPPLQQSYTSTMKLTVPATAAVIGLKILRQHISEKFLLNVAITSELMHYIISFFLSFFPLLLLPFLLLVLGELS